MYLIDSDVAKKIAQYNLFNELANSYESELSLFSVLPELKYQLKLSNKDKCIKKLGSEQAYIALSQFLSSATEINFIPTDKANQILDLDQSNLDIGEQVLLAAASSTEGSRVISGDKRAFVSISKINDFEPIEVLWPLLICFENALQRIVLFHNDFSAISKKVRGQPKTDSAIKVAFGVSVPANLESVVQALESYIGELIIKTDGKYIKS